LWEGAADCTACQAHAVTLWPNGPARVSLKPDSHYTAQLEMDAAGDPDRSVFRFVSGSWELPSHSFDCHPEHDVMVRSLYTNRVRPPTGGDTLWLRVSILSSTDGTGIELLLDTQAYAVDWVGTPP
jgi:hypothetical protein